VWDRKGIEYLVQALNSTPIRSASSANGISHSLSSVPSIIGTSEKPSVLVRQESFQQEGEMAGMDEEEGVRDSYGSFVLPAPLLKEAEEKNQPASVQTIRMDGCLFKTAILEPLGRYSSAGYHAVR
jgi:protein phosphatase 1 regulatory subunit 37